MRVLAKIYKTYDGAQRRAAFERAHGKPDARVVSRKTGYYQVAYGPAGRLIINDPTDGYYKG